MIKTLKRQKDRGFKIRLTMPSDLDQSVEAPNKFM